MLALDVMSVTQSLLHCLIWQYHVLENSNIDINVHIDLLDALACVDNPLTVSNMPDSAVVNAELWSDAHCAYCQISNHVIS